ncbi:ChbG/HpnK family deacetylase [Pseudogulbenkiania sp. MAI-1]|uniref:ChbG/HpnK family deacetylase n=1 Tax=Pseudogulbenkiania sp. MAI-1 TaxID=990370 RepID=UPI00045E6A1F|nr:ChbG/HpnK family deacetylase [Pseudogulbenkiania sp. MAI-1]
MSHRLTLCADDFAQSPAISAGILALLERRRLSATSVFSLSPLWPSLASELSPYAHHADIGLHCNLTHPFDDGARPLGHWLLHSQLRLLSRRQLCDVLLRQIDAFADALGRLPAYLDGHQHVHALPVVRDALFDAIALRWRAPAKPYLRAPDRLGDGGDSQGKGIVLKVLCAGFAGLTARRGYHTPSWFGGLYSLSAEADFPGLMRRWLRHCPDGSLIMCHPGLPANDSGDPIASVRQQEYRYLASPAFEEDCQRYDVTLLPFVQAAKLGS